MTPESLNPTTWMAMKKPIIENKYRKVMSPAFIFVVYEVARSLTKRAIKSMTQVAALPRMTT